MDRRGFLGSVIGTVFTLPFFARLETEEWQRVVLPYRMLFRDSISGFRIQAPGVAQLVALPATDKTLSGFRFTAERLNITKTMCLDSVILLTEKGQVIKESKFNVSANMCKGDFLNVTQDIFVPPQIKDAPIEDVVKAILEQRVTWN